MREAELLNALAQARPGMQIFIRARPSLTAWHQFGNSMNYQAWIDANVTETYGTCREVTEAMAAAFPELTRVRGHYYCYAWGERAHWWLTTRDGTIVDPTASQFPSKGVGHYEPWNESQPEPTGICANCGEYVYDSGICCSDSCSRAYAAYCMNPL